MDKIVKLVLRAGHSTGTMKVKTKSGGFVAVTAQGVCIAEDEVTPDMTGRLAKLIEVRAGDAVDGVLAHVNAQSAGSLVPGNDHGAGDESDASDKGGAGDESSAGDDTAGKSAGASASKAPSKKKSGGARYRSAESGKLVSAAVAKANPKTTVKEGAKKKKK